VYTPEFPWDKLPWKIRSAFYSYKIVIKKKKRVEMHELKIIETLLQPLQEMYFSLDILSHFACTKFDLKGIPLEDILLLLKQALTW